MRTIIKSGKIKLGAGLNGVCESELEYSLYKGEKGPCFTASGCIWHKYGGESGGQILDEIAAAYPDNEMVNAIHAIWKQYHLNDMNAGTPEQQKALKHWKGAGYKYEYDAACQMLKDVGLYEVPATPEVKASALGGYDKDVYTYGSRWLYRSIPDSVLAEIQSW